MAGLGLLGLLGRAGPGWAGLGLLGRAVHCNWGRPELRVMLPAD